MPFRGVRRFFTKNTHIFIWNISKLKIKFYICIVKLNVDKRKCGGKSFASSTNLHIFNNISLAKLK